MMNQMGSILELSQVNYDMNAQWLLSAALASMVLGVALNIKIDDFKQILAAPKAVFAGLSAQFLILPAATFGLTLAVDFHPGIELGMLLVAACPGGAVSNFVTQLGRGNVALSISLTACASLLAIIMLPFNFLFWAQQNPDTAKLMTAVDVDEYKLMLNLILVLAVPLFTGLVLRHHFASFASQLHKILNITSSMALAIFILVAVSQNFEAFTQSFATIFWIVLVHNALAYGLGFCAAKLSRLNRKDTIATVIEVGMQNSSLAIAIVFTQFSGQPEMALICAFWGTWHLLSGVIVAFASRSRCSEARL